MKYNIFKTDNYLIIADDSEIKEGDFLWSFSNKKIVVAVKSTQLYVHSKKIIAHLPLNNSPILEGVDLLPPLEQEDDVEKLAELNGHPESSQFYDYKEGFIDGFLEAKEKYKWTDKDVIKIVEKSRETGLTAEYFLLSLSQPKYPISFEQGNEVDNKTYTSITRRNDGFTLWIGKYIY